MAGLLATHTEAQRRVEEPLVLSLARVHVERDATRGLAVDRDVEALDRRMPALLMHDRREGHAEELAVQVEDRLPDAAVLEVRTDLLRVEVEALRLHAVEVVRPFPVADRLRTRMIDALFLEQDLQLVLRGVRRRRVE